MSEYYNPEVQQLYPDTCAIKSQQLILKDFGIDVSETELVQTANANGWYNGGGTSPEDVGNLLNLAGIPVSKQSDANVFNLVNELAQGHEVIVGVDADELWHNSSINEKLSNWFNDVFGEQGGNHALIVAGIDTRDPNNIQVIVKDPGSGEDGKPYPLDQFMDAWSDTQCYMVSTDVAAPQNVSGMENFNYQSGHIDNVVGIDYSQFQIFNDISMGIPAPMTDINGNFVYNPSMSSLVDAYMDVAHNEIPLSQIWSPQYEFNNYLDFDAIQSAMCDTLRSGINHVDLNSELSWDNYMMTNGLSEMTNIDYFNYLNQTIDSLDPIIDMASIDVYNQQLMMLDYCNYNNLDFSTAFYDNCFDL